MKARNKNVMVNLMWRFAERCGAQGVSFIVSIVLARLLEPETFGLVALITAFISILNVFVDSGLGAALIQKKDSDDIDFSSVFFFNIVMCIFLYVILFCFAPFVAKFYGEPQLTPLIRVLGIILIISGVKNIQQAYVSKKMMFKVFFWSTLIGTIISAVIGITLAYKGFGVWALILQQLSNSIIDTFVLSVTVKWKPKIVFSLDRLKSLLSFGWKLLVSAIIETVYNNIRSLLIGKLYSSSDLAFYNKGERFPNLVVSNINSAIDSVLLPVLAKEQDNIESVKRMTRRAIQVSSYIMCPVLVGLAVCAKPVIILLLTEKWIFCVPYLQIFCFYYVLWPIHTANLSAIQSIGRSDIYLFLQIIKKVIGIGALIIALGQGPLAIAYSCVIVGVISSFLNAFPNVSLLNYRVKEQLDDIIPSLIISVFMAGVVYLWSLLNLSYIIQLPLQILTGAIVYAFCSHIFNIEGYVYIMEMVKSARRSEA